MKIVAAPISMQSESERLRSSGKRIAVVPTMGSLHRGHLSLIEAARQEADVVVTTIFVNPTQFGPNEDFARYPRDLERDTLLAERAGTDLLFTPSAEDMYPNAYRTYIGVEGVSGILEGSVRPTHFRGVTTIVAKLFNIVKPHVAVFGQKDAQQAFILRRMAEDLNFDVRIVIAPIVREPDGLALSSRNAYLSPAERANAVVLFQALKQAEERIRSGERSVERIREEMTRTITRGGPSQIDYVAVLRPDTFEPITAIAAPGVLIAVAVRFGATRLIDNIIIPLHSE